MEKLLYRAELFEGWLVLTRVSFSFHQKHFLRKFSLLYLE